jgi:hypothetical protein
LRVTAEGFGADGRGFNTRRITTDRRSFGYDNVSLGDDQGVVLAIDESEAATVGRIFQMSADGASLKKIAGTLNQEHVPTPRPQARNGWATWCSSAVRDMLYRKLYIGRVIWNRSKLILTGLSKSLTNLELSKEVNV